jgi:hypothetical protein
MRGLKNADRVADFFFINEGQVDLEIAGIPEEAKSLAGESPPPDSDLVKKVNPFSHRLLRLEMIIDTGNAQQDRRAGKQVANYQRTLTTLLKTFSPQRQRQMSRETRAE